MNHGIEKMTQNFFCRLACQRTQCSFQLLKKDAAVEYVNLYIKVLPEPKKHGQSLQANPRNQLSQEMYRASTKPARGFGTGLLRPKVHCTLHWDASREPGKLQRPSPSLGNVLYSTISQDPTRNLPLILQGQAELFSGLKRPRILSNDQINGLCRGSTLNVDDCIEHRHSQ